VVLQGPVARWGMQRCLRRAVYAGLMPNAASGVFGVKVVSADAAVEVSLEVVSENCEGLGYLAEPLPTPGFGSREAVGTESSLRASSGDGEGESSASSSAAAASALAETAVTVAAHSAGVDSTARTLVAAAATEATARVVTVRLGCEAMGTRPKAQAPFTPPPDLQAPFAGVQLTPGRSPRESLFESTLRCRAVAGSRGPLESLVPADACVVASSTLGINGPACEY
jgi:hypothetical protein